MKLQIIVLIIIIFLSFVSASEENLDVAVKVVEKIEAGDIVQLINNEFQNQKAEVINIDEKKGEAVIRIIDLNLTVKNVKIKDMKIIATREEIELRSLNTEKNFILAFIFLMVVFVLILLEKRRLLKKKRKQKQIKKVKSAKQIKQKYKNRKSKNKEYVREKLFLQKRGTSGKSASRQYLSKRD